jgi:uncharacterized membrane protein
MWIYGKIYYTLYRMILKLADMFSTDNETPRIEAVLILSFLTTLNVVTFFGLISTFIGESILSNNKLYVMLELSPVFGINFLLIFYKRQYQKIESDLQPGWKKEKRKNIVITIGYIIFTVAFFMLSIEWIKRHHL